MATSSRPFQSQTVSRLVAGYRQLTHGAGRWLRQGRTAVVWAAQVALYPLYAVVQTVRLGYRRLGTTRPWQRVWARLSGVQRPQIVEADTPIRALLSVLQPPVVAAGLARPGGLQLVSRYGSWLQQSRAGAVLTPGQWHLMPLGASVRGIASDLGTRRLVLVTRENDIFSGLTDDQQWRLEQAIALMLAEYAREHRQRILCQRLQRSGLPLPQANARLLLPLRWVPHALRWMQISALAAATNLFGEASQQRAIKALVRRRRDQHRRAAEGQDPRIARGLVFSPGAIAPHGWLFGQPGFKTLPAEVSLDQGGNWGLAVPAGVSGLPAVQPTAALQISPGQSAAIAPSPTAPPSPVSNPLAQPAHLLAPPTDLEARVTQVDYIDSLPVALLRGLDRMLHGLETWLRRLWDWVQKHW